MILINTVHGIPNSLGSEETEHFYQFFQMFPRGFSAKIPTDSNQRHTMQVRAVASTGTSEFSKVAGPFKTTMAVASKCTDSAGASWGCWGIHGPACFLLLQWPRVGSLGTYWFFTRLKLKILIF